MLGLCYCTKLSLVRISRGFSLVVMLGFIAVASLVVEPGF